jgi:hypothetical protein
MLPHNPPKALASHYHHLDHLSEGIQILGKLPFFSLHPGNSEILENLRLRSGSDMLIDGLGVTPSTPRRYPITWRTSLEYFGRSDFLAHFIPKFCLRKGKRALEDCSFYEVAEESLAT